MEDDFDIKSLPNRFVSVSKPSAIIEQLEERRRKEHNEAIEYMRTKKKEINLEIDECIKNEAEKLKEHIHLVTTDMTDEMTIWKRKQLTSELEQYLDIDLSGTVNRIDEVRKSLDQSLDTFDNILKKSEKTRLEKCKLVLKEVYQKIMNISYKLPFEAQEFLEKELLDINQISLNNLQHYADFQKEFKLQIGTYSMNWSAEMLEVKEHFFKLLKACSARRLTKFRQSIISSSNIDKLSPSREFLYEVDRMQLLQNEFIHECESLDSTIPVQKAVLEEWLTDVQKTLAALDQSAKNLVNLYKSIIIILFNRFFSELEDLKEALVSRGMVDKNKIENFQSDIYTPPLEELNINIQKDFDEINSQWGEHIRKMQESLKETYQFLKGAVYLWDKHFERLKHAQLMVLEDLELTIAKNDTFDDTYQANLNIIIDKMRQSPTEKKLKTHNEEAIGILDALGKSYVNSSNNEIQVIQKYKTLLEIETEVLVSELKRFLSFHPPDEELDPKKQRKRASQISEIQIDINDVLPPQMYFCKYQTDAVKNWTFGLWEAITQYVSVCKTEIMELADKWVNKRTEKVKERLEVKFAFHKPRYQRLEYSIYKRRLYELNKHNQRFTCHKLAIDNEIAGLREKQSKTTENYITVLKKFEDECNSLLARAKTATMSKTISHHITYLNDIQAKYVDQLEQHTEDYKKRCKETLYKINVSNYLYLKSVRLFAEEGNFCAEEMKNLQLQLLKINKTIEKQAADFGKKIEGIQRKQETVLENKKQEFVAIQILGEFLHNEKATTKIKNVYSSLEKQIVALKTSRVKVQKLLQNIISESENAGESIGFLNVFEEQMNDIKEKCQDLVPKIMNDDILTTMPTQFMISRHRKSKSRLRRESVREVRKSRMSTAGFSEFEQLPQNPEGEDFLSVVGITLHMGTKELYKEAQEFYSKHPNIILERDRIQPTEELFMNEVGFKLQQYYLQCEEFWLGELEETYDILLGLRDFRNQFLLNYDSRYLSNSLQKCEDIFDEIMADLKEKESATKNQIKQIYNKLKVCHGHPNNRNMLEELDADFIEFLNANEVKYMLYLGPIEERFTTIYNGIEENLNMLQENIARLQVDDSLVDILNEFLEYSNKFHNTQYNRGVSATRMTQISKFSSYWKAEQPTSLMSCLTTQSPYVDQQLALEDIELHKTNAINMIRSFIEDKIMKPICDFKDIWGKDIKQVLKLYKVKYDKMELP